MGTAPNQNINIHLTSRDQQAIGIALRYYSVSMCKTYTQSTVLNNFGQSQICSVNIVVALDEVQIRCHLPKKIVRFFVGEVSQTDDLPNFPRREELFELEISQLQLDLRRYLEQESCCYPTYLGWDVLDRGQSQKREGSYMPLTGARSGMKRSPMTSTSLDAIHDTAVTICKARCSCDDCGPWKRRAKYRMPQAWLRKVLREADRIQAGRPSTPAQPQEPSTSFRLPARN